jgi:hypothetical protein
MKPLGVRGASLPGTAYAAKGADPWTIGAWTAGASTTLSVADGRARATRAGDNPRIYRIVSGLTSGVQYRITSRMYKGTVSGDIFFRVADGPNVMPTYAQQQDNVDVDVNVTFVAPSGGIVYVGLVAVSNTNGQYAETDETFSLRVA